MLKLSKLVMMSPLMLLFAMGCDSEAPDSDESVGEEIEEAADDAADETEDAADDLEDEI